MAWNIKESLIIPALVFLTLAVGGCIKSNSDTFVTPEITYSTGSLAETFGTGGIVRTAFRNQNGVVDNQINYAAAVAIQADHKIVILGNTAAGPDAPRTFAIARYLANGSLDTSFDADGMVTTAFEESSLSRDLAILENGKILAAGTSSNGSQYYSSWDQVLVLARYNIDGSLDTSFGTNGSGKVMQTIEGMTSANAVAIFYRKIIIVGTTDNKFALARFNADGSLDTAFGINGLVTTSFGNDSSNSAWKVAIQADGKIVVAGVSNGQIALARYKADGTLDPTFGSNGLATTAITDSTFDGAPNGVFVQTDGKIVVGGTAFNDVSLVHFFFLARYDPNGNLDTSFDSDGVLATSYAFGTLAVQADGKIVVAGADGGFTVIRYNPNGSPDTTFGSGGMVTTPVGDSPAVNGLSIDNNGHIFVAGRSSLNLGYINEFFTLVCYD